jgi:oxygen-dependent protoporphyrinogen oxidase
MEDETQFHDKNTPAATNRFIYYPDHLVRLPGKHPGPKGTFSILETLSTILREPLFEGSLRALGNELFNPPPQHLADESVASFLSRRFNAQVAENIASALCHGIYAGDVHKLSSDVMLPIPRLYERMNGSVIQTMVKSMADEWRLVPTDFLLAQFSVKRQRHHEYFRHIAKLMGDASVFTVKDGLGGITSRFVQKFNEEPKIQVITNAQINSMKLGGDSDIIVGATDF